MPREDLSFDGRENSPEGDKRKDENESGRWWKMKDGEEERREIVWEDGENGGQFFFYCRPRNDNNQEV